ncbi:hypothetical protein E2C01_097039 [Portunus trituberculatus]|uniref:Uncharacterized protein n=1 Tax=Portunus trituberculatus TaxID=210409 RepID=A0A5B7K4N6_PORTR|nr:hypothetical protein [Portunus trituberculatus]
MGFPTTTSSTSSSSFTFPRCKTLVRIIFHPHPPLFLPAPVWCGGHQEGRYTSRSHGMKKDNHHRCHEAQEAFTVDHAAYYHATRLESSCFLLKYR